MCSFHCLVNILLKLYADIIGYLRSISELDLADCSPMKQETCHSKKNRLPSLFSFFLPSLSHAHMYVAPCTLTQRSSSPPSSETAMKPDHRSILSGVMVVREGDQTLMVVWLLDEGFYTTLYSSKAMEKTSFWLGGRCQLKLNVKLYSDQLFNRYF